MWAKQTVGGLWTPVELTKFLHIFEVLEVQIINITPIVDTPHIVAQLAVMLLFESRATYYAKFWITFQMGLSKQA